MSWLEELTKQHSELESPQSFYYWAGLAAISAVLKDQVWLPRHIYNLYPNVYILLHAESGLKKGPPVAMSRQLVKTVNNTRIISGRSSIQGILKDLGTAFTMPGGKINAKSVAFICSSELSSSIVEDKVATTILTDLYDRQYNVGEWRSLLKTETFELKNPTITMLTATNEAMSSDFFTRSAIQGGYFARTFIIHETKRNRTNSLLVPLSQEINYTKSAEYLKELSNLNGPFQSLGSRIKEEPWIYSYKDRTTHDIFYFTRTGIVYQEWYDNFLELVDIQETKDETGTLNRFGDSVLKVAMLLSLANKPELILTEEAMNEAIKQCEKLLGNIRKTTMGKHGISNSALLKSLIIMELLNRDTHNVSRTILMKKLWMNYESSEEFDNLMQSFDAAGMIKTNSIGNQIIYTMPNEQVSEMRRFMDGKSSK
jgi:hypothetical protein